MKIFVTGGANFIRLAVIRYISQNASEKVVNRVSYTFGLSKNEYGQYLEELSA